MLLLVATVSAGTAWGGTTLRVAVASNAAPVLEELAPSFEADSGDVAVELIATSSGILERQIRSGAPYDVFLSADVDRVVRLAREGLIDPATVRLYASGRLVGLWPPNKAPEERRLETALMNAWKIALPNPEHAPYGVAARAWLEGRGLWPRVQERLVFGENVGQTIEFIRSGNADIGFVPLSLVRAGEDYVEIPGGEYPPVLQAMGMIAETPHGAEARRFLAFLETREAEETFRRFGYRIPADRIPADWPTPSAGVSARPFDWRPILLTFRVAIASTLLALLIGAPLGYWLATHAFPGKGVVSAFVLLPLVLPPTVLGYYLLVLVGREGPVGEAWAALTGEPLVFTTRAAILAASVATIPIVTRQLASAFEASVDPEVIEAARLDGAGGPRLFLWIYLPLIRPHVLSAATIAFARAVGDFGATLMVAGNIPGETQTASIAIYELMNAGRDSEALVLVVIVSLVSLVVLAATATPAADFSALAGRRGDQSRSKSRL